MDNRYNILVIFSILSLVLTSNAFAMVKLGTNNNNIGVNVQAPITGAVGANSSQGP